MSDYLKKPNLSKSFDCQHTNEFMVSMCQMQGWRKSMEDAKVFAEIQEDVYIIGVFDGHGGPEVAQYVAKMIPQEAKKQPLFKVKKYIQGLNSLFKRIDDLIHSERGQEELKVINKRLGAVPPSKGQRIAFYAGCTACLLLLTKDRYYLANIGDSRAVLMRNGQAVPLSYDHKPDKIAERERIEKAGGYVHAGRVNGILNLSRAFGDFQHKVFSKKNYMEQPIISVPEIIELERSKSDEFIFIGCDGVWEKYVANNQKMVDHINQLSKKHKNRKDVLQKLLNDMVAKDWRQGNGTDNMTEILIEFF